MVTVIAKYQARTGAGDAVAVILQKHVAATRSEPGCIQFDAFRSHENRDEFVLFERYVNEGAFEAHRASEHFAANVQAGIVPLLVKRNWHRYEEVAAAG